MCFFIFVKVSKNIELKLVWSVAMKHLMFISHIKRNNQINTHKKEERYNHKTKKLLNFFTDCPRHQFDLHLSLLDFVPT